MSNDFRQIVFWLPNGQYRLFFSSWDGNRGRWDALMKICVSGAGGFMGPLVAGLILGKKPGSGKAVGRNTEAGLFGGMPI